MRTPILAVFCLLPVFVLSACTVQDETGASSSGSSINIVGTLPDGTFGQTDGDGYGGDLVVRGYAETEKLREPFCTENCKKFTYVFLRIIETGDKELPAFLGAQQGNAYARPDAVGLGCVEDGIIRYQNDSDELRMREFTLSPQISAAILASSEDAPVTLRLSKKPLTGGSGAPSCYSHFTQINLRRS